jgi:hypothetical protein
MVQPGGGTSFVEEALLKFRLACIAGMQYLDGDISPQHSVVGTIDGAHAALAEQFQDLVSI